VTVRARARPCGETSLQEAIRAAVTAQGKAMKAYAPKRQILVPPAAPSKAQALQALKALQALQALQAAGSGREGAARGGGALTAAVADADRWTALVRASPLSTRAAGANPVPRWLPAETQLKTGARGTLPVSL
jgi:hypothetical protein